MELNKMSAYRSKHFDADEDEDCQILNKLTIKNNPLHETDVMEWDRIDQSMTSGNVNADENNLSPFPSHTCLMKYFKNNQDNQAGKNFFTGRFHKRSISSSSFSPLNFFSTLKISDKHDNECKNINSLFRNQNNKRNILYPDLCDVDVPNSDHVNIRNSGTNTNNSLCFNLKDPLPLFCQVVNTFRSSSSMASLHSSPLKLADPSILNTESVNNVSNSSRAICPSLDKSNILIPSLPGTDVSNQKTTVVNSAPNMFTGPKPAPFLSRKQSCMWKYFKIFIKVSLCLLLLTFCYIFVSRGIMFQDHQEVLVATCLDHTLLESTLKSNLFGQHLALENILYNLQKFVGPASRTATEIYTHKRTLVLFLHGWVGTGKTHTGQLISSLFPKDRVQNILSCRLSGYSDGKGIKKLIQPMLHPPLWSLLFEKESDWPVLIIIDDIDDSCPGVISEFAKTIEWMNNENFSGKKESKTKFVFLVLSNIGGDIVNDITYEALIEKNIARENISIDMFLQNKTLKNIIGDSQTEKLLKNGIIDSFIPFLPLEKEHVRMCARHYLSERNVELKEKIVNEVVENVGYFPEKDDGIFSRSGCKRVAHHLDKTIYENKASHSNCEVSDLDSAFHVGTCRSGSLTNDIN